MGRNGFLFDIFGSYTRWHVSFNDFWGILYYARHVNLSEPPSLFNGFYPIGYALLLKMMPVTSICMIAGVMNALLGAIAVGVVTSLVSLHGKAAALVAWMISTFWPLLFEHSTMQGADIGGAAFTGLALWLLLRSWAGPQSGRIMPYVLSGVLLGMASLWRSHFLLSSALVIVGWHLFFRGSSMRTWFGLASGFVITAAIQPAINLLSGHGVFETAQIFNVYKTIHGVDWWNPPITIEGSVWSLIAANPQRFFFSYWPEVIGVMTWALAPALCACVPALRQWRSFAMLSLFVTTFYAIPVALGGSVRAIVVLLPFILPCIVLLGIHVWTRLSNTFRRERVRHAVAIMVMALFVGSMGIAWLLQDYSMLRERRFNDDHYRAIRTCLVELGMKSTKEVFIDDSDLYCPEVPPYEYRYNGGWGVYSLYGYNDEFRQLPMSTREALYSACRREGIRFLVLSQNSQRLAPFLNRLYLSSNDAGSDFIPVAQLGRFRIFILR